MPVLFKLHFGNVFIKEFLRGLSHCKTQFLVLKLELSHTHNNLKKLIAAQFFIRVVLKVTLFPLDLLKVDGVELPINICSIKIFLIYNLPGIAQISKINHTDRRVVTRTLSVQILLEDHCIILLQYLTNGLVIIWVFHEFVDFGILQICGKAFFECLL